MIFGYSLSDIAFVVGKITIIVFMLIHILAIIVLIRQAVLASRVVIIDGNRKVLLFAYVHVILLIAILLIIILLPEI
jgi:hypothetical protein